MKKKSQLKQLLILAAVAATLFTSCGTALGTLAGAASQPQTSSSGSVLGDILGAATNGQTVGNVIQSVIGGTTITQQNIIGTWKYSGPGCAFTSDQLLAKAGGEVAAAQIKQKMLPTYQQLGFSASNTQLTFNSDGTFSAKIGGKSVSGKYTFDEANSKIALSGLLLNANCYVKRNAGGIAVLFEASKLLTVLQTLSALSGNATLSTIGDISKNYDGVRLGFDLTK